MWELYDELIEGIPGDLVVDELYAGAYHSLVVSGSGFGVCGAFDETWRPDMMTIKEPGMKLRDLAACIKSWNYTEAGLGLAAVNAYYNETGRVRSLGVNIPDARHVEDRTNDPFITYQNKIKNKRVATVGRFKYLNQLFAPVCSLSVIEKYYPEDGDFPEQAADYLLPESDYVFIGSYTLVEKSLPHLLELAGNAHVILVGPYITLAPALYKYGVDNLSGFVIKDKEAVKRNCLSFNGNLYSCGQKVCLIKS
jgi:uncharacterized protein (DUF4213/DUF364 family)